MSFSALLIGSDTLTVECGKMLLAEGHAITAVVTRSPDVRAWAERRELRVEAVGEGLAGRLGGAEADWILSIANLDLVPDDVLALPGRGAVNFHDGPLPRHAGLNAPVWALLEGETRHGIAWQMIEGGIDEGDILVSREIAVAPDETALTLNMKCFAAALESFPQVMEALASGDLPRTAQDLSQRTLHRGADVVPGAAAPDFAAGTDAVLRLVRALDHGDYLNPVALPRVIWGGRTLLVRRGAAAEGAGAPGEVLARGDGALTVATADGAVRLEGLTGPLGEAVTLPPVGSVLEAVPKDAEAELAAAMKGRRQWTERFADWRPARWGAGTGPGGAAWSQAVALPPGRDAETVLAAFPAVVSAMCGGAAVDLALSHGVAVPGATLGWVPLRFDPAGGWAAARRALTAEVARLSVTPAVPVDLPARLPDLPRREMTMAALSLDEPVAGAALTLTITNDGLRLHADTRLIAPAEASLVADRVAHLLAQAPDIAADCPVNRLPVLPPAERALVLHGWNATEAEFDAETPIHRQIAAQAAKTPDAPALSFEGRTLTYAEVEGAANRAAQVLRGMGVTAGTLVGLHVPRSAEMVVAALAIWKAGGAYVPLDPAYPAERIALYLEDSGAPVVVTTRAGAAALPGDAARLGIDADPRLAEAPAEAPEDGTSGDDLAYLIYTSGSTGRPKGVMVEHRNVSNFFAGMDGRIAPDGDVWLAVTSLSFDISVLELFWTLSRGFHVVVAGEDSRALKGAAPAANAIDFSLFYWGNDDGVGRDKYGLLLEGAKFADANGFCAVWTPERHFHAFGGPYPNPSVTGAAVAAVTHNIAVRAGSCVAPLHHTARIAEEWAVIDNLTNGRAGLAIASGWQPDDFVLRPENAPPKNKTAMFDAIRDLRRLWAGEAVEFPRADGTPHAVVTQPRPVSERLPLWVTTAGNPETWREAGANGCNVLTHLLGQSIAEVAEKIGIYHAALRESGHDPADHTVTLMLHTYLAADRETAREVAREPMKDYLRSAAALIKQYAWAFPAFKKPQGVDNPMQIDLGDLSAEEMDAILDFAFARYFDESGLFGTVEDAVQRVEELKAIGVDEVACLIDYGIDRQAVLDGLRPLAEVLARVNAGAEEAADHSVAALIARHGVTHLQCTPAMARMYLADDATRGALADVRHLMIGGEALPGALVAELAEATGADVENMYGPTETTIWSTTQPGRADQAVNDVGTPIANTQVYVLDDGMQPCPVGVAGELWIGGAGVARGYWRRDDLTDERFRADPFRQGGRIYRTGDLARWRADGALDFLGRADGQVKVRGYRIEPGEIEAALEAQEGVTQAVVVKDDGERLVGYIAGQADEAVLKARLAATLPPHMVPARIVTLDAFPLTPNRKVDRNALPRPEAMAAQPVPERAATPAPAPAARPAAPAAPMPATTGAPIAGGPAAEDLVAAVWTRVLNVAPGSARANFFEIGGHSLLAVQAHRELRAETGLTALSITDLFRFPTLGALAARIESLGYRAGPTAPAAETAPAPAPAAAPVPAAPPPPAPATPTANDDADPVADSVRRALAATVAPAPAERNEAMARRRELRLLRTPKE
ncbi:MupA/Atu3671 family FMN-dependent luciferase-like monooxygenase [Wenxinia marina]|uniref:Natural product biosynthesis luciferase-like monooxygenase domain protein n=1 Tax=Wenxinia marina DSM 24838 TaxID=1123501 RepID=A0A0D0Q914_9RHOB|nr:MupA/Atu3671 family FMN-dependent luciferase-like monooxygenase [Wenxinia marina]KIQ70909.1 natural product biosynthesis luciferase-like monooxygenase domain protein [Wenxinia marina DSM 24838]GGL56373.1 hypothetical protein GCM10011392_08530 [Wenxinia marina]